MLWEDMSFLWRIVSVASVLFSFFPAFLPFIPPWTSVPSSLRGHFSCKGLWRRVDVSHGGRYPNRFSAVHRIAIVYLGVAS